MAKKKIIFLVITIIVALLVIFLPGYTKLQDLMAENKRLEKRIGELEQSIEDLGMEKDRLENDITYIEKIAREKMGVAKDGERIIERYRVITVIGSSNTDFSIKTPRLPKVGETLSGGDFFMCPGGKGANQAAQVAKLGGKVSLVANIGKDTLGDMSVSNLKKLGVQTNHVTRDIDHRSGVAFIIVDKLGRNQIIVSPGSNHHLRAEDVYKARSLIARSEILLLQLEIPYEAVEAAVDIARENNVKVILNPAPYRFNLKKNILSGVDILTPNEVEAGAISGIALTNDASTRLAGLTILRKGVGCVVITRGKKGAAIIDRKGFRTYKSKKVKPVDSTCAGDSFNASLAFALHRGKSIDEAVKFANSAASLTVTKMGAQSSLPMLQEVKKYRGLASVF